MDVWTIQKNFTVSIDCGKNLPVSDRLREERERLGLTQVAMAERGGVTAKTQVNYEGGRSAPDADYLGRLAALGLDVLYVVTGQRTPDKKGVVRVGQELSRREQALLEGYRATNDMGRRIIEGTTSLVSDEAPATKDGTRG